MGRMRSERDRCGLVNRRRRAHQGRAFGGPSRQVEPRRRRRQRAVHRRYVCELSSPKREMPASVVVRRGANRRIHQFWTQRTSLSSEHVFEARGRALAGPRVNWRGFREAAHSRERRTNVILSRRCGRGQNEPVGCRGASAKRAHAASLKGIIRVLKSNCGANLMVERRLTPLMRRSSVQAMRLVIE